MKARILMIALLGTAAVAVWVVAGCGGSTSRGTEAPAGVTATADRTAAAGETRYMIGFKEMPTSASEGLVTARGGVVRHRFTIAPAMSASISPQAAEALQRNPNIEYVRPAFRYYIDAQTVPWGITRVGAPTVHASGNKGAGVKVAVLDTGIDYSHPDLAANYKGGYNFVGNNSNPMDDHGHGTHVAGTVAAVDNSIGVIGVAPEASLYAVKVINRLGWAWEDDIIAGVQWCVANGMQVASMSFGGAGYSAAWETACNNAYAQGVLLVAAAGNSGAGADTVSYPAKFASVIAVAATDSNNNRASFSSTGPAVELAAPGVGVLSTTRGGGYAAWNGTSMACPHVSGAAALVMASGISGSAAGVMSPASVRTTLQQTAQDLGTPGRDQLYGFGLLRADLAAGSGPPTTGTISGVVTSASGGQPISGATVQTNTGQSTQTGANGAYTLGNVPTGSRQVTASAAGYQSQTATVQVVTDQTTTQDFALAPVPPQPGSVAGRVYRAGSGFWYPIPRATVQTDTGQSAVTNWWGQYSLTNVPPGARQVTASATGYQPQSVGVQVVSGQTTTQDFFLTQGTAPPSTGTISGVVRDAVTSSGIAGATVQTDTGQTTQSGANGAYTLSNVPQGSRQVTASAAGYQSQSVPVQVVAGQTTTRDFDLQAAAGTTGAISGTVRDAGTGAGIPGALVRTDTGQSTQTGANGAYTLSNVPQGSRRVTVSAARYRSQMAAVQVTAGQTTVRDFNLLRGFGR